METITMYKEMVSESVSCIILRLDDGPHVQLYHTTGIRTNEQEVTQNQQLQQQLERHKLAMCKAYTLMQLNRMDINSRIFEIQIQQVLRGKLFDLGSKYSEPLIERLFRYINEAFRDGVVGRGRYAVLSGKAGKLKRFLTIKGLDKLSAQEFTPDLLLEYRQFIYDEYLYVPQFPQLYPVGGGRHAPTKRCKDTTVVHDLKALQAFFSELEDIGEIPRSPFRKISREKRRNIMHVLYDAPYFLKANEFRQLIQTAVPHELQWAKDLFVLNCALGCRISDLKRLSMDKLSVSEDGIPYIHYIPSKTAKSQKTNLEIQTPVIRPALEIILRTQFDFNGHNTHYETQLYNKMLRDVLCFCGINRRVCIFDSERGDNIYLPLCDVASSKLARKTHIDMLNKVQINYYAAGLHRLGSDAVFRYTSLELADRFALLNAAFGEEDYRVSSLEF